MGKRIKTTEDFIEKSKNFHGDVFTYEKTNYVDFRTPMIITCKKCGDFKHTSKLHFKRNKGCPRCNRKIAASKHGKNSFTKEQFIEKAKKVHKDKFDYSKVEYINSYTRITIICPVHGESEIEPRHHYKGSGCYRCGRDSFSKKQKKYKDIDHLLDDLKKVHKDRFDYSEIVFPQDGLGTADLIPIVCREHGLFYQPVRVHSEGSGCNKCRFFGYTKEAYMDYCKKYNKSFSTLYLLRFYNEEEEFYKIGITAQTITERYRKEKDKGSYKYEVVFSFNYSPNETWDREQFIKTKFIPYNYKPKNWFPGITECFTTELPIEEIITYLESI